MTCVVCSLGGASPGGMVRGSFSIFTLLHGQGFVSLNLAVFLFGLVGILGKLTGLSAPEIPFGRVLTGGEALGGLGIILGIVILD